MLNMDFNQSITIDTNDQDWIPSPMPGVWRKPLAREEAERGHATSIVRYDPGASFSPHGHPAGEEILVLDGVFSDQSGDYSAGTYFRNPEGFSHAPFSQQGCTILVKLHQFQQDDSAHITIQSNNTNWLSLGDSLEQLALHQHHSEQVYMLRNEDRVAYLLTADKGVEIYIVAGGVCEGNACWGAGSWLRRPTLNSVLQLDKNSVVWIKQGHLSI